MHIPVQADRVLGSVETVDIIYPGLRKGMTAAGAFNRLKRVIPLYKGRGEYEGCVVVENYYPGVPNVHVFIPLDTSLRANQLIALLQNTDTLVNLGEVEGYCRVVFEGTRTDLAGYTALIFPETVASFSYQGVQRLSAGGLPVLVGPARKRQYEYALVGGIPGSEDVWVVFMRINEEKARACGVRGRRPAPYAGYTVADYERGLRGGYLRSAGVVRVSGLFGACGCRLSPAGLPCRLCLVARLEGLYESLGDEVGLQWLSARSWRLQDVAAALPPSIYPRLGFVYA